MKPGIPGKIRPSWFQESRIKSDQVGPINPWQNQTKLVTRIPGKIRPSWTQESRAKKDQVVPGIPSKIRKSWSQESRAKWKQIGPRIPGKNKTKLVSGIPGKMKTRIPGQNKMTYINYYLPCILDLSLAGTAYWSPLAKYCPWSNPLKLDSPWNLFRSCWSPLGWTRLNPLGSVRYLVVRSAKYSSGWG